MQQRFAHAQKGVIDVWLEGDTMRLEMSLVIQGKDSADGRMQRYSGFPMVVGHGDTQDAALLSMRAQLHDYLQAFFDLNGPLGMLQQFEELGFTETEEDDWAPLIEGPIIEQSLRANPDAHC